MNNLPQQIQIYIKNNPIFNYAPLKLSPNLNDMMSKGNSNIEETNGDRRGTWNVKKNPRMPKKLCLQKRL